MLEHAKVSMMAETAGPGAEAGGGAAAGGAGAAAGVVAAAASNADTSERGPQQQQPQPQPQPQQAGQEQPVPVDDLSLSLDALAGRLEHLTLRDGVVASTVTIVTSSTTLLVATGSSTGAATAAAPAGAATAAAAEADPAGSAAGGSGVPHHHRKHTHAEIAAAGCRRIMELVHNNPDNKAEALHRGALPALATALTQHAYAPHVQLHAARAVRSITFKNQLGRDAAAANEAAVVRAVCSALREALEVLDEYHGSAAASGAGAPSASAHEASTTAPATQDTASLRAVDPLLALGLAEETLTTLAAICNNHGAYTILMPLRCGASHATTTIAHRFLAIFNRVSYCAAVENTAAAVKHNALSHAERAMRLLPTLRWPPPAPASPAAAAVRAQLGTAATLRPGDAVKKAMFLQMMLTP